MAREVRPWGCHSYQPIQHPWIAAITDCACGYDWRLKDPRCLHCRRSRIQSPREQLDELQLLGDVAKQQNDIEVIRG